MLSPPPPKRAKRLGAYYTPPDAARFMLRWALRAPDEHILDPSFGGGVFLDAALKRGHPPTRVWGVEIDSQVHGQVAAKLCAAYGLPKRQLVQADFFDVGPPDIQADVITGNPPFVRYQTFKGRARQKAQRRAAQQGVQVSGLASAWACFVVHACSLLKPGGRLAFVVPAELGHAAYARPVLRHLTEQFAGLHLLSFRQPLFPNLSQDALIVLAEGKGAGPAELYLTDFDSVLELNDSGLARLERSAPYAAEPLVNGRETLRRSFISKAARRVYQRLEVRSVALGELASVGIGYVSGANRFFHLSPAKAQALDLPPSQLRKSVFRGAGLRGLTFTEEDFRQSGTTGYLFDVSDPDLKALPETAQAYIAEGEKQGVDQGYKCRRRNPWYNVPGVSVPDAFLSYMSGRYPKLSVNMAQASAPNSLHLVHLNEDAGLNPATLALLWHSSFSLLSAELSGHALGGGMLKLEPNEARRVRLAWPGDLTFTNKLVSEVDALLRNNRLAAAVGKVDEEVLVKRLGLNHNECALLKEAAAVLRERRSYRGKRGSL